MPYEQVIDLFQGDGVGELVACLLDLIDYQDLVDGLPRRRHRRVSFIPQECRVALDFGDGSPDNPIDLSQSD
jgi:hypothetical protein